MAYAFKKIAPALLTVSLVACGGGDADTGLSPSADRQTETRVGSINEEEQQQPAPAGQNGTEIPAPSNDPGTSAFVYDETARFNGPGHIVSDAAGNLYVNDFYNQRIRKVSILGDVSTHPAPLSWRQELEIDAAGNLYTLEGNVIRRLSPDGVATDHAVIPEGSHWMTMDAAGYLHVLVVSGTHDTAAIFRVSPEGTVAMAFSGPPLNASSSRAIAVDSNGNRYVGSFGGAIVKIPAGGTPVDYAHVNSEVEDLATDAAGNLYVARGTYSRPSPGYCMGQPTCEIRVVTSGIDKIAPDGMITNLIHLAAEGEGSMTANQMGVPRIATGSAGYSGESYVYAAFSKAHVIYKLTPDNELRLIAGAPGEPGNSD